jgi:hypothetical protein
MALTTSDSPNENKAGDTKPKPTSDSSDESKPVVSSKSQSGPTEGQKLSVNDSRLNNQTNVYGVGPDSGDKSIQQEVEEKRAEAVAKLEEKDADLLASVAGSGDADVHNLLGQRAVAVQNGDTKLIERIDRDLASGQKQTSR